jgi:peptidoglycan/xylan/chitin deacetylase (PgdA/CDA1 family)
VPINTALPSSTFSLLPPTATATVTWAPSVTPTFTPSPVPTPTWVRQGPDSVLVPILMYHHVEENPIQSNYRVPAGRFEDELRLMRDWGYTSITTSMLVDAITRGADLPPRPVIITFDDGNLDNYTIAFPLMQKYGFTGVLYIVADRLQADGYMNASQIQEMTAAGWEVGSHSLSHPSLTDDLDPEILRREVVESKTQLEAALGVPVLTFAYPFGNASSAPVDYVKFAGYIAAMGATGFTANQGLSNLYILQRCEIKGSEDAKTFIRFLPWHGDPAFLPTDTPTPTFTPTRTPIPTYTQYPTRTP